jgi:hypothetical protein
MSPYLILIFSVLEETRALTNILSQEQTFTDNWTRDTVFGQVQFGDGAAVAKNVLPSDLSVVRLHNLPRDSTEKSVAAFLKSMGSDVSVGSIRLYPAQGQATNWSAVVRVEDPLFATKLSSRLASRPEGSTRIEAVPIPATFYSKEAVGSSVRDVSSKKVAVSWYRPTRTVWLNFASEDMACEVKAQYDSEESKILGQRVETSELSLSSRMAGSVTLLSVPTEVTIDEIQVSLPLHLKPRHIEFGEPSFQADAYAAGMTVRSMLEGIGALEWWQYDSGLGGKRNKAQAVFFDEADARRAVNSLHNAPLTFGKNLRLTIRLVHSAKFRVLTRIYEVSRTWIEELLPTWRTQYLRFDEYLPVSRFTTVKIEGEEIEHVAQGKKALEAIFAGVVAIGEDGVALWHPSLIVDGSMFQKLQAVEAKLGVAVCRDKQRSQLRLFGSKAVCERAVDLITEIVQNSTTDVFVIELTPGQVEWAYHGGFRAVRDALRDRAVTFDILSSPKCIVIAGCSEDYNKALEMVSAGLVSNDSGTADSNVCSVCWCPPDDAVKTNCGHVYCRECFENLCRSGASSQSLIECKGDADTCKKLVALAELQEKLDTATSEAVLEQSAMSHIKRYPDDFRPCPTPGCERFYRVGTAVMVVCPDCHVATCSTCHEQHSGMSCGDYKDRTSGAFEASQKVMAELGIKDCPKCKTAIEKTEGCNHMTCGGCDTHMCWICLKVFRTAGETYDHLAAEHGGIFGDEYAHIV